jgi:hypothetical protein
MNTITANPAPKRRVNRMYLRCFQAGSRSAVAEPGRPPSGRSVLPQRRETDCYARAIARENSTSIRVPERGPVLIWNWARLASTSALVSERLTPELSEA